MRYANLGMSLKSIRGRKKLKNYLACAAVMAALASTPAVAATINQYTNQATFLAGLTSISVEDFNDGTVDAPFSVSSSVGSVGGGVWNDRLTTSQTTTWSFASAVNGFGGLWDQSPGGPGMGIAFTLTLIGNAGQQLASFEVPNSLTGSFFGLISDVGFSSILLTAGSQGGIAETYNMDNLTTGVSAVPLPAGFGMLVVALGSLGILRRKRRS